MLQETIQLGLQSLQSVRGSMDQVFHPDPAQLEAVGVAEYVSEVQILVQQLPQLPPDHGGAGHAGALHAIQQGGMLDLTSWEPAVQRHGDPLEQILDAIVEGVQDGCQGSQFIDRWLLVPTTI